MKRIICYLLATTLLFLLIGCSENIPAIENANGNNELAINEIDENANRNYEYIINEVETKFYGLNIINSFDPAELVRVHISDFQFDIDIISYKFTYESDNETVVGFLVKPVEITESLPVVIWNRGGNRDFGMLTDEHTALMAMLFVENGFTVMASQYRGVDGGTGMEQFGGDDVSDVLSLIDIATNLPFTDARNIFLYGESRGGMMTYRVLQNNTNRSIRAAVIDSGIADLFNTFDVREQAMRNVLIELVGGSPAQLPDEFYKRSAVKWANDINTPLLILHSKDDWRVSYQQALDMVEQLELYNKEYKFISFDGDVHGLIGIAIDYILEWFEKHRVN